MTISLENLELIPKLLDEIKALKLNMSNEKKWLNTTELCAYIGYSIDSVHKMVKENTFIDGIHYYQPSKKLLFDKHEVDNWIVGFKSDKARQNVNLVVNEILANIL
jgi:predicted DNA-binding transcriptional regulator AlpA